MWFLSINKLALISPQGALQKYGFTSDGWSRNTKCWIFVVALWIRPLYSFFSLAIHGPENGAKMMKIVTTSFVNTQVVFPSYFLWKRWHCMLAKSFFFSPKAVKTELSVKKCVELPESCWVAPNIWNRQQQMWGVRKLFSCCSWKIKYGSLRPGIRFDC